MTNAVQHPEDHTITMPRNTTLLLLTMCVCAFAAEPAPALPEAAAQSLNAAIAADDAADRAEMFEQACQATTMEHGDLATLIKTLAAQEAGSPAAAMLLAHAHLLEGEIGPAYEVLKRLAEAPGAMPGVWAETARVAELLAKSDDALKWLDKALADEKNPGARFALTVRKFQMLYDMRRKADARKVVATLVETEGLDRQSTANYCARIAALCGDTELALELFRPTGEGKSLFNALLMRGTLLLKQKHPVEAATAFDKALELAKGRHDQMYAQDRLLAAAREAGTLGKLADDWMKNPGDMSPVRMRALLRVLSQQGRADDALTLLDSVPTAGNEKLSLLLASTEFQDEVIAVALDAGRTAKAAAAYRRMIAKHPSRVHYRMALGRLLILDERRDEAIELFEEGVSTAQSATRLMTLAESAQSLGLLDMALTAARRAGKRDAATHVQAVLFEVNMLRDQGDTDKALELVLTLQDLAAKDTSVAFPVVEALEASDRKEEALKLLRIVFEETKHPDVLVRIIAMAEDLGKKEDAFDLWKLCWENATRPAREVQARERMMDLAARQGNLANIAIELEERMDNGKLSDKELNLLVGIYTSANDPVSAAEILMISRKQGASRIKTYERMARVYYECEIFGRFYATLHKLARINPEKAEDYLQQVAVLALERRQMRDAMMALDALLKLGENESTHEFCAGVIGMLGRHADAAQAYRKALARHPDHIETWLLWGNMMVALDGKKRNGPHRRKAFAIYQVLTETTSNEDMFTVAVDGLLNLNAPPEVLRSTLRRIRERIALQPHKVNYYRLAADLYEELDQVDSYRNTIEMAVIAAGMRRGALLRELMDASLAGGMDHQAIAFGKSLMNIVGKLPPDVCLNVADALLDAGKVADAERAFRRAAVFGDAAEIMRRAGKAYLKAGLPDAARRVFGELLITEPGDVLLQIGTAYAREELGDTARARQSYLSALDMLLTRQQAAKAVVEEVAPTDRESRARRYRFQRFQYSENELSLYRLRILAGLIRTTPAAPEDRDKLVAWLHDRTIREFESLKERKLLRKKLADNPRLEGATAVLIDLAKGLHCFAAIRPTLSRLIAAYPGDKTLAKRLKAPSGPSRIDTFDDKERLRTLIANPATRPIKLVSDLPRLVIAGHDDLVRLALARLFDDMVADPQKTYVTPIPMGSGGYSRRRGRRAKWPAQVKPEVLAAALAIGDEKSVSAWCAAVPEACKMLVAFHGQNEIALAKKRRKGRQNRKERKPGPINTDAMHRAASIALPYMTDKDRAALDAALRLTPAGIGESQKLELALLRMELTGPPTIEELTALLSSLGQHVQSHDPYSLYGGPSGQSTITPFKNVVAAMLNAGPADQRSALLESTINLVRGSVRHDILLGVATRLEHPSDDALCQAFNKLLKAGPAPKRFNVDEMRSVLATLRARDPKLGKAVGEAIWATCKNHHNIATTLAIPATDPRVQKAAVLAVTQTAKLYETAQESGPNGRRLFVAKFGPLDASQYRHVVRIGRILTPANVDLLLNGLRKRAETSPQPADVLILGTCLLQGAGRETEAFELALTVADQWPEHERARGALIDIARMTCNTRALAQWLETHLETVPEANRFGWSDLAWAQIDLHDPEAALRSSMHMPYNRSNYRVVDSARAATMTGDLARVQREMSRLIMGIFPLEYERGSYNTAYRASSALAAPPVGGLPSFPPQLDHASTLSALAGVPGTTEILLTFHRFSNENVLDKLFRLRRYANLPIGIKESVIRSALTANMQRAADRQSVLDYLKGAVARKSMNLADVELALAVAFSAPDRLPADLLPFIRKSVFAAPPANLGSLARHATVLRRHGDEDRANAIERWIDVAKKVGLQDQASGANISSRTASSLMQAGITAPEPHVRTMLISSGSQEAARSNATNGDRQAFRRNASVALAAFSHKDAAPLATVNLRPHTVTHISRPFAPNPCGPLPDADKMDAPADYVDILAEELAKLAERRTISRDDQAAALCLLGQWCLENKLDKDARQMLERADELARGRAAAQLWVADLARLTGDTPRATQIELALLKTSRLPILRVENLLNEIETAQDRATADRLAVGVAEYSQLPAVLTRAARADK